MVQELTSREGWFVEKMNCTDRELAALREFDPTGKAWTWALKGLRDGWLCAVEAPSFQEALASFNALRQSPKFKEIYSPDLLKYSDFNALIAALKAGEELKSNKRRAKEYEGADLLGSEDGWALYRVNGVNNYQALKQLSSGTSWCTAQDDQAKSYLNRSPIYNARYEDQPVCQIDPATGQFHDTSNRTLLVGRTLLDGDLGHILLKYADEKLNSHFRKIRFVAVQRCVGPGADMINATARIEDRAFERAMFQESPTYQVIRYAKKFLTEPDKDLEIFLSQESMPTALLEYYSCEVRQAPWDKDHQAVYRLAQRAASYARYLAHYFDLTTYKFDHEYDDYNKWLETNPQVKNDYLLDQIAKGETNCSTNSFTYYTKMKNEHPVGWYRLMVQNCNFSNLSNLMVSEAFKALPEMDEEVVNELVISSLHRHDRWNHAWNLLQREPFASNPVLLNYLAVDIQKNNWYSYRSEMVSKILIRALKNEATKGIVLDSLIDAVNREDHHSFAILAEGCQDFERLDPVVEKLATGSLAGLDSLVTYLENRTKANFRRDWADSVVANLGRRNFDAWTEYSKTADISEKLKTLVTLSKGSDVDIIKRLLALESLEAAGITLDELVLALFGQIPNSYVITSQNKERLVMAGILKRKFGWEIPAIPYHIDPEIQIRYYYHTGQREVILSNLTLVRQWAPREIARFMTHLKSEWKDTEIARRLYRYKKDIAASSAACEAEYNAFWGFVETGQQTEVRSGCSYLGKVMRHLGAYQATMKPAAPEPQMRVEAMQVEEVAVPEGFILRANPFDVQWQDIRVMEQGMQAAAGNMQIHGDMMVMNLNIDIGEPGMVNNVAHNIRLG